MGHAISSLSYFLSKKWNNSKEIVMVGFDSVGKTTILEKVKLGDVVPSLPMANFHTEIVKCQNLELTSFDLGGDYRNKLIWRYYYDKSDGAIFVFDSLDRDKERCENSAEELHRLSSQMAEDRPLLIFANKQDFKDAMNMEEINENLRTRNLRQKTWYIQLCSAKTGEGLNEGFEWIWNNLWPKNEVVQKIRL